MQRLFCMKTRVQEEVMQGTDASTHCESGPLVFPPILSKQGSGGMKRGGWGGPSPADEERLGLGIALEGLESVLPAKTALLDAAKRDFGGEGEVPVHPDNAGLHP